MIFPVDSIQEVVRELHRRAIGSSYWWFLYREKIHLTQLLTVGSSYWWFMCKEKIHLRQLLVVGRG
ncbi:unnamed protein product [Prunus armeniaca]|uniref:Uncharacterized protein n=1 Tax=Prunus armeniaca TaxID=36596 RepID=A0A6J5VBF7_PRUAR|nr:unnamed protein product [Prunus armeniaca]